MADTLACFHSNGSSLCSIEVLNIIVRGFAMTSDTSGRTRGCNLLGRGDLLFLICLAK